MNQPIAFPPQHQDQVPGLEWKMVPRPIFDYVGFTGSGKLKGIAAIITGDDSGIGRAAAVAFAKEGADLTIVYLHEEYDANETKKYVEQFEVNCLLIQADLRNPSTSELAVARTVEKYGRFWISW